MGNSDLQHKLFQSHVAYVVLGATPYGKNKRSHTGPSIEELKESYIYVDNRTTNLCIKCDFAIMEITPDLLDYWLKKRDDSDK